MQQLHTSVKKNCNRFCRCSFAPCPPPCINGGAAKCFEALDNKPLDVRGRAGPSEKDAMFGSVLADHSYLLVSLNDESSILRFEEQWPCLDLCQTEQKAFRYE